MREKVAKQAQARLARIQGQLRGVGRMIEEQAYCIDVLTQLSSISSAVDGLGLLLLDDHVKTCVSEAVASGEGEEKVEELMQALKRFVRS